MFTINEGNLIGTELSSSLDDFLHDIAQNCGVKEFDYSIISNHKYTADDKKILNKLAKKYYSDDKYEADSKWIDANIMPELKKMFGLKEEIEVEDSIEIQEEFKIPGTDLVLEKGDKIQIVKEAKGLTVKEFMDDSRELYDDGYVGSKHQVMVYVESADKYYPVRDVRASLDDFPVLIVVV